MIRHYEKIGLIPAARRTDSGYRAYTDEDAHSLGFIRQPRNLGFSIKQIGNLLGLWRNKRRPCRKVKALVLAHIAELDERIGELEAMKRALTESAARRHGDHRPECPILDGLAANAPSARAPAKRRHGALAPMRRHDSKRVGQTT